FAVISATALLLPALAACQPAAPAAPPTTAATTAPAKPTTAAVAASPSASVAASPSASAKPAASPSPGAAASPSPAAAQATPLPKPQAGPAPTGDQKGSTSNPVAMAFVPSADSTKVLASGEPLAKLLTDATNLNFKVSVPTSYTAVIEAMGANQVDVGWLAPFAYVLAHDKNGSQVLLASFRQGSKTYRSQIAVTADSGISTIAQLTGN